MCLSLPGHLRLISGSTWGLHGRRELNPTICPVTSIAQTHRHSTRINIHNKSINDLIIKIYGPAFSFLLFFLSYFLHSLPFFPCPRLFLTLLPPPSLLSLYPPCFPLSLFPSLSSSPFSPSSCPDCLLTSASLCFSLPSVVTTFKSQCVV